MDGDRSASGRLFRMLHAAVNAAGSIAMVVIAVVLLRGPARPELRAPVASLRFEGAFVQGSAEARIVVAMYADYRCPYCIRFARQTLAPLRERYVSTGHVQLVFRNLPLDGLHPDARFLAAAAVCAGWQGRFWEMHDWLFAEPISSGETLNALAGSLKLDSEQYLACLDHPSTSALVNADLNEAHWLGVSATPTFLLGRRSPSGAIELAQRIEGFVSIERFEEALRRLDADRLP